ncbi:MAG: hypothetical protein ABI600_08310 [Luteolibacter sp.]
MPFAREVQQRIQQVEKIPGDYPMVSFGAVVVESGLERTFYGELRPISEKFVPEALAVSGVNCGTPVSITDIFIAATGLRHKMTVVTKQHQGLPPHQRANPRRLALKSLPDPTFNILLPHDPPLACRWLPGPDRYMERKRRNPSEGSTGQVMKSATIKPNPKQVNDLLRARLL